MSDKLGPRTFGKREEMVFLGKEISEQRDYSDRIAEEIDSEVHTLVEEAYALAKQTLTVGSDKLHQIAQYLIEHETVEGAALQTLFSSESPGESTASPSQQKKTSSSTGKSKAKNVAGKQRTPKERSSEPNTAPAPAS